MAKVYDSILDLVGKTPLVELKRIEEKEELQAKLIAKVESFNPAGSVKDRIAKAMIEDAEAKGLLKEGSVIIEPTSGNTGIGLAAAGNRKRDRIIPTPGSGSYRKRLSYDPYDAGNHERRAPQHCKGIRRRGCSDGRNKGYEGCDRESR